MTGPPATAARSAERGPRLRAHHVPRRDRDVEDQQRPLAAADRGDPGGGRPAHRYDSVSPAGSRTRWPKSPACENGWRPARRPGTRPAGSPTATSISTTTSGTWPWPAADPRPSCRRLVSRWYEDPFDPSRPLWQFVVRRRGRGRSGCTVRQAAPHHQRRHRPPAPVGALPRHRAGSAATGPSTWTGSSPKPRRHRRPGRRRHLQPRPSTVPSSGSPAWPDGRLG